MAALWHLSHKAAVSTLCECSRITQRNMQCFLFCFTLGVCFPDQVLVTSFSVTEENQWLLLFLSNLLPCQVTFIFIFIISPNLQSTVLQILLKIKLNDTLSSIMLTEEKISLGSVSKDSNCLYAAWLFYARIANFQVSWQNWDFASGERQIE